MLWFSRRKRRKIVASRIIEEMARCEKGMKIGRDESEYIYIYVYMCMYVLEDGCRRFARVGAQFCNVNLWHRARGVYHSASEFVVLRLVTSKSIFRTQTFSRLSSFYLSLCSRLFTCIIFAKDTRKMFTRFCAFKVVSYKPRAIRRNPTGFLDKL